MPAEKNPDRHSGLRDLVVAAGAFAVVPHADGTVTVDPDAIVIRFAHRAGLFSRKRKVTRFSVPLAEVRGSRAIIGVRSATFLLETAAHGEIQLTMSLEHAGELSDAIENAAREARLTERLNAVGGGAIEVAGRLEPGTQPHIEVPGRTFAPTRD